MVTLSIWVNFAVNKLSIITIPASHDFTDCSIRISYFKKGLQRY
jgi:hypothetical protein